MNKMRFDVSGNRRGKALYFIYYAPQVTIDCFGYIKIQLGSKVQRTQTRARVKCGQGGEGGQDGEGGLGGGGGQGGRGGGGGEVSRGGQGGEVLSAKC